MSRKIIVLAGEAGVGKDTFAKPLITAGFNHGSFAANLKQMCQTVFNISPYLTDTQEGKMKRLEVPRPLREVQLRAIIRWIDKTHDLTGCAHIISEIKANHIHKLVRTTGKPKEFHTAREILQFVGTDICRRICPDYHVDVLAMKIEKMPGNWVITDARFPNERAMLKKAFGATLIRLKRPGFEPIGGIHESELSFGKDEEYDVVFNNSGTIEDLQNEARRYL